MLEFEDIQHFLLTRAPALTGRYEFLSFRVASWRPSLALQASWKRCGRRPMFERRSTRINAG